MIVPPVLWKLYLRVSVSFSKQKLNGALSRAQSAKKTVIRPSFQRRGFGVSGDVGRALCARVAWVGRGEAGGGENGEEEGGDGAHLGLVE